MLHRIQECRNQCNQAFFQVQSEREYLQKLPGIILAACGYHFCWIGYKGDGAERPVVPIAQEGFAQGYLSSIRISWADDRYGQGPTGIALRTGEPNAIQNIVEDPRYEPWREAALKQGYRSSAAIPLKVENEVIGCLNLYSKEAFGFPDEDLTLLVELAAGISLAIACLRKVETQQAEIKKYKSLFEEAPDGIFVADQTGNYLMVNKRGCELLGYTESEIRSMQMADLTVAGEESIRFKELYEGQELISHRYLRTKDGIPLSVAISGKQLSDGRLLGIVRKIREFGNPKTVYTREIGSDPYTHLPDRYLFRDTMSRHLAEGGYQLSLAVFNLDGFQRINDAFGRKQGLYFLQTIGERIQSSLAQRHLFAYAGADEYYVLFLDSREDDTETEIKDILKEIEKPLSAGSEHIQITASVGWTTRNDSVQNADIFLNQAHTALSWAKKDPKARIVRYQKFMEEEARKKIQMEAVLTDAILKNRFQVFLQGKFALPSRELSGYEALMRINYDGEILLPGGFIALAEETGLIHAVGSCLLQQLALSLRERLYAGLQIPNIALNLSPVQFQRPDLSEEICRTLETYKLSPSQFTLEITESALFTDPAHAIRTLTELRKVGFRIAIDDFGTGFSSLGAIRDYPFDSIKIDRSFIQNLFRSAKDSAIVATIIQMGETLGVEVVAEGVETQKQLDFLIAQGCKQVQGFLLHRPEAFSSIRFPRV